MFSISPPMSRALFPKIKDPIKADVNELTRQDHPNTRSHTIMASEEEREEKHARPWTELEISGKVCNLSLSLFDMTFLTGLYLNDNNLTWLPPEISRLCNLQILDVCRNQLCSIPAELGLLISLREVNLAYNNLKSLPPELGKLYKLKTLNLAGNPLPVELHNIWNSRAQIIVNYLIDQLPFPCESAPQRPWITTASTRPQSSSFVFTVMCFNILCEKYATKALYGYCPNWALNWEYRQKGIMNEIQMYSSDIISLQEVETDYFNKILLPEMRRLGYDGIFSPKSRAKTMSEVDRRHVDGCAIFYRTSKFTLLEQRLVEFNQLAMANAEGCEDMLNRVMTKDNIGLAALLQVQGDDPYPPLLVSTVHIHWDPEFCDVKLIQTMMLVYELKDIIEEAKARLHIPDIPLLLCGDFNSLPSSGVIEFLSSGRISKDHPDFKQLGYSLNRMCNSDNIDEYTHPFKIARSYSGDELPYTNFTYDFKGIIDYIFYSSAYLRELGVLGPVDPEWMQSNKVIGCPHPQIPSDHFPLVVELELYRRGAHQNGVQRR